MKRWVVLALVLVALSLIFFVSGRMICAQDATGPESVTLPGGSFGQVTFSHSLHTQAAGCKDCHHMGEVTQKCNSCHTADASMDSKTAFHTNCIDCHKEKSVGPTGCMDCHKK